MLLGPVTRSSKMTCQERWDRDLVGPEETRRPEVNLRNEIEILGGYLKVAQMNSWGWERWTDGGGRD